MDWDCRASLISKHDNQLVCIKHYLAEVSRSPSQRNNFLDIRSILRAAERDTRDLDVLILYVKTAISLFKTNADSLQFMEKEIENHAEFEKIIQNTISIVMDLSNIVGHTTEAIYINTIAQKLSLANDNLIEILE